MIAIFLTFPLLFVSSAFVPLEVLTVIDTMVFSVVWNTFVPAIAVLVAYLLILGSIAVHLLNHAAKADLQ